MSAGQANWIDRHISRQFAKPFRLAFDLLREPNPAARSALYMAGSGLLLTPLDMLLEPFEQRIYARATPASRPIVLVAGPPRSGTTLVEQTLINHLDVAYFNNLTALFPRSPILSNRLLGGFARLRPGPYDAFYGKSRGLSGANDALYLWDRWLGADRSSIPAALIPGSEDAMPRFFGAFEALYGLPVINKVNRLNTCAHLVAKVLPDAHFIFLQRNPLMLAQSLFIARQRIVGDRGRAYGVQHSNAVPEDPVEDVCRQVVFHELQLRRQQELLPRQRYRVVSYEQFCAAPGDLIASVRRRLPVLGARPAAPETIRPFSASERRKLPPDIVARMEARLDEAGAGRIETDGLQV